MTDKAIDRMIERFGKYGIIITEHEAMNVLEIDYSFAAVGIYGDLAGGIITLILRDRYIQANKEIKANRK